MRSISVDSDPDIALTKNLTDAALRAIADKCPQLKSFETNGDKITDEGLKALSAGCPELELIDLTVSGNRKGRITDSGLMEFPKLPSFTPCRAYWAY